MYFPTHERRRKLDRCPRRVENIRPLMGPPAKSPQCLIGQSGLCALRAAGRVDDATACGVNADGEDVIHAGVVPRAIGRREEKTLHLPGVHVAACVPAQLHGGGLARIHDEVRTSSPPDLPNGPVLDCSGSSTGYEIWLTNASAIDSQDFVPHHVARSTNFSRSQKSAN
jgi:hypothetical protein